VSPADPPGGERDKDSTEIDATFAAIVAGWGADEPAWPQEKTVTAPGPAEEAHADVARAEPDNVVEPDANIEADIVEPEEDEGHYAPPEPPPIPRPHGAALGALILLGTGLILLFVPGIIGLTDQVGLPLGLLAEASGLFWLFLLLRTGPPIDSGWDDGSRL